MGFTTRFPEGMLSVPGPSQDTRLPLSLRGDAHPDPDRYTSFPADKPLCINDTDTAWTDSADQAARPISPSAARILAIKKRRTRRAYIEAVGNVAGSVPRWISRRQWLEDVSSWAYCEGAQLLCRRVAPTTFLAVAAILAEFSDSADGRHCAVTNRVAGHQANCSERTVSTVRSILSAAGFAVLAKQGSGGGGRPNRVAVWHLVSRREPVDNNSVCHLPPSRRDRGLSNLRTSSPTPPARRGAMSNSLRRPPGRRGRRWRTGPRPLALQRLAADLVARTHGLGHGHIGVICDALTAAGIDPASTSAAEICRQLYSDMRATGLVWPDTIERPGAFLAYRLKRLAPASLQPAAARRDDFTPGSYPGRLDDATDDAPPVVRPPSRISFAEGECSVCGSTDAPPRPWLPARRAHVCDPCWLVAGQAAEDRAPCAASVLAVAVS